MRSGKDARQLSPSRCGALEGIAKRDRRFALTRCWSGATVFVVKAGGGLPTRSTAARDLEPELRPLPDAETQALAALCQRRNQLLEMEQMEKSRLQ
jgi:hypothetical protein